MDPRRKTWQLAENDLDKAREFVEEIVDDWYRCQALAMVASKTKEKNKFRKIVSEALRAAQKLPSPNRQVSCAVWIIKAMSDRADVDPSETVEEMLSAISNEDNPVRQADALLLLFEAVYSRKPMRDKVLKALLGACGIMKSWKQPRMLGDIALILAKDEPAKAQQVLELINHEPTKRKTLKSIEKREWLGPHEFYPYYAKAS